MFVHDMNMSPAAGLRIDRKNAVRDSRWEPMNRLVLIFILLQAIQSGNAVQAVSQEPITRVAGIRVLSREDAAKALPVRLEGVVIWQVKDAMVIWDGEKSVWVAWSSANQQQLKKTSGSVDMPTLGTFVEIEGCTAPGGYAPIIIPKAIRRIGMMDLPKAAVVPMERLLSGCEDAQLIELEGVLQQVEPRSPSKHSMFLMVDGHSCRLHVENAGGMELSKLVDARIKVRGIFSPDANIRSEGIGLKLMVSDAERDIDVIEPPPRDPFAAPRVALNLLLPFSPDAGRYRRKVVSGVVTFAVPGWFFFLQGGKTSVRVNSPDRDVRAGRQVDVAGFVNTSHTFASLGNAQVRDLGPGALPAPVATTVAKLLDPSAGSGLRKARSNDLSGQLVTIRGTLLRIEWKRENVPAAVRIGSDDRTFPAFFPIEQELKEAEVNSWVPGAEVELTGIAEYDFEKERNASGEYPLVAFHLWLTGPSAIQVLKLPSWWTPARLGTALAVSGGALILLLAWTWTLRHRVKAQTAIISGQIQREAVQDERARIAQDMHDEVGARLSQIAILQDIFARDHPQSEPAREDLARLAAGTQEAVTALDEAVWTVNPQNDTLASMAEFIAHHASSYLEPAEIACRIEMPIEWPALDVRSQTRHELVCACKEALQNVVKHSKASEVTLSMGINNKEFFVEVADNGCGFAQDAAAHGCDGLNNMKARLRRIGGTCDIADRIPTGTTVSVTLPLHT